MSVFTVIGDPHAPLSIYDRMTTPDEPGTQTSYGGSPTELAVAFEFLGYGDQYREEHVNSGTALQFSAVWACVRWISQTIAALSWNVFERSADEGNERLELTDNTAWLLDMQANPEVNSFEFRQSLLKDALTFGNGYAEIERDGFQRIRWLWRLSPDRVEPTRDDAGRLIYVVKNPIGSVESVLRPEQMFHLKGLGPDGIVGWSVIEMARRSIELGVSMEKFGKSYFKRGPMPGGILKVPSTQDKLKRAETRRTFEQAYGGSKNAGGVVVVSAGYEFTPLTLPNKDAEWIASRKFAIEEIARWYGVPPHKIGDLDRATFSNVEQQAIEAVQDCLLPWCRRLEMEADVKMFGSVNRGSKFTKLNLEVLLRGDSTAQTETLTKKVNGGLMTPNEARKMIGLNPTDSGNELLAQGAMTTLQRVVDGTSQIGNAPPGTTPPKPDAENPAEEMDKAEEPESEDKPPAAVLLTFGKLLANCYADFLRIEADKARRAANKGKLVDHCDSFYCDTHQAVVKQSLSPIFAGFLLAIDRQATEADGLANEASTRHIEWSKRTLTDAGRVPDDWESRAAVVAAAELKLAWDKCK